MHELGIVFHIARRAEEVAKENNVKHLSEVVLEVGEVSTVVPEYLTDCWNWYCKKIPELDGSKLTSIKTPAVTLCEDCQKEYSTVEHGKKCPYCGSENTYLLKGQEVMIKEVMADEE